jgi:SHS2 domain-containing protein
MSYEFFSHTADLGIRVRAATVEDLFAEAGKGLFAAIVARLESVEPKEKKHVQLEADRLDDLLYDWLSHLLYLFDAYRMVFSDFAIRIRQSEKYALEGVAMGEPLSLQKHELHFEVKAVTYHRLRVEQVGDGSWEGEFIVDL